MQLWVTLDELVLATSPQAFDATNGTNKHKQAQTAYKSTAHMRVSLAPRGSTRQRFPLIFGWGYPGGLRR